MTEQLHAAAMKKCIEEHSHSLRLAHEYEEIGNKWCADFWRGRAESYLSDALRIQAFLEGGSA